MIHSINRSTQTADTAQLRPALQQSLDRHFGLARPIISLERRPSAFRSSFAIDELEVQLDDGTILHLIFKDLRWQALLAEARLGKPTFLYNPLREIETYRSILSALPLNVATFYGAAVDVEADRYWLFLEKVPGTELYQVGELAIWQQVACWLAAMHARFANGSRTLTQAQAGPLIRYDEGFYRRWLRRARTFLHQAVQRQPGTAQRSIDCLTERYDRIIERLLALPATFIHGEFYASNVLVQETATGLRICPVDWEMAAIGPGLMDLAALTAGQWTEEEKKALALAYYQAMTLDEQGFDPEADFLASLDCCRLHLAIQWLGWSPRWSPPPAHAQDWLAEALFLAEKLEM